ncbi:FkbM family methyltransferase [Azospirillum sp. ST 5-10]|uniref:FkbM family methyltransferase n=1 Tax=unclassified Azospirillum TaxID=2630922 RepID=UPI003F4A1B6E
MTSFDEHPTIGLTETRLGPMFYPRNDRYVGRSLEEYGEYARLEIEVFRLAVARGQTVVDAGANIGAHTVLFSTLVGDGGRVLAFEPQRAVFQVLNANLMLAAATNVETWNVCLGADAGRTEFPQVPLTASANFGGIGAATASGVRRPVERRTIDSFALDACHFVKIDVEGAEAEVVAGAMATIAAHRPVLCIEAERPERVRPWFEAITGLGYRAVLMIPRLFVHSNWKGNPSNVFGNVVNANLLAFPGAVPDWAASPRFGMAPVPDLATLERRTAASWLGKAAAGGGR